MVNLLDVIASRSTTTFRNLPYVVSCITTYQNDGPLKPGISFTIMIEVEDQLQTPQFIEVLQTFINVFGVQPLPVIETGPTTICISQAKVALTTQSIALKHYVQYVRAS